MKSFVLVKTSNPCRQIILRQGQWTALQNIVKDFSPCGQEWEPWRTNGGLGRMGQQAAGMVKSSLGTACAFQPDYPYILFKQKKEFPMVGKATVYLSQRPCFNKTSFLPIYSLFVLSLKN